MKTSTPSSSIEDYVKVIYSFTEWQDKPITSTQLAQRLGVANSSVSEMVRKLKDQGLVCHKPYSAITLTAQGVRLALSMVRRHRLIETYLVQDLGYSWDEVHDEAEQLEHAVSDTFIERMAARLGNPTRDPHGDPIPSADGTVQMPSAHRMSELDDGHTGRITRISDENPGPAPLPLRRKDRPRRRRRGQWAASRSAAPLWCASVPAGTSRDFDLADEVTSALWVHSDTAHAGWMPLGLVLGDRGHRVWATGFRVNRPFVTGVRTAALPVTSGRWRPPVTARPKLPPATAGGSGRRSPLAGSGDGAAVRAGPAVP